MNWKIRLKNPVFWVQVLTGALATVLAYRGVITGAFSNPYCLFLVASNIWSALNDPTTSGISDSARAKGYTAPSAE